MNASDQAYQKAYKRFRTRVIQARKDDGLTQVEVAKRLGKPNSFISKRELGEHRVDIVELQQLAKIYRKEMDVFWDQPPRPALKFLHLEPNFLIVPD